MHDSWKLSVCWYVTPAPNGKFVKSDRIRRQDAGYTYVNVDDCYSERERSPSGDIVESRGCDVWSFNRQLNPTCTGKERFPSGMNNLTTQLHELGLYVQSDKKYYIQFSNYLPSLTFRTCGIQQSWNCGRLFWLFQNTPNLEICSTAIPAGSLVSSFRAHFRMKIGSFAPSVIPTAQWPDFSLFSETSGCSGKSGVSIYWSKSLAWCERRVTTIFICTDMIIVLVCLLGS